MMRKWAVLGVVLFVFLAASLMGASAVAVSSPDGALGFSYGKASETVINEARQNCEANFDQKRDCKLILLCSGGGFGAIVQSRNFDGSWAMGASCGFADQMSAQQAAYTECKKERGEVCQTFKHWQDVGSSIESSRSAGLSGSDERARYKAGAPTDTHGSSGTLRDSRTGLIWTRRDNGDHINWNDAVRLCSVLRLEGSSDWRLPTIDELEGIYDPNNEVRMRRGFDVSGPGFWSSSRNGPQEAWFFFFHFGKRLSHPLVLSHNLRALCVRRSGE